jgi:hypothetical protein
LGALAVSISVCNFIASGCAAIIPEPICTIGIIRTAYLPVYTLMQRLHFRSQLTSFATPQVRDILLNKKSVM